VKVDPDFPFTVYIARWDSGELRWATTETDDDTRGILWLDPMVAVFWAELNMPYWGCALQLGKWAGEGSTRSGPYQRSWGDTLTT
jgi:hypothetical protein